MDDPVVLAGSQVKEFCGSPVDRLRLLALREGVWRVIPFQIDERDEHERYLYDMEYRLGRWRKGKGVHEEGILSAHDEIVFMCFDSGDRAEETLYPGAIRKTEIELLDPLDGGLGYVYLCEFERPPPLSSERYVDQRPEDRMILTEQYAFGFLNDGKGTAFDFLAFGNFLQNCPADLRGRDILDTLHMDLTLRLKGGLELSWDEEDLRSGLTAYRAGPVRVLQRTWFAVDLLLGLRSPRLTRHLFHYPGRTVTPTFFHVPFNPRLFLKEAHMRVTFDYESRITGAQIYHPEIETPILIDGRMSVAEQEIWTRVFTIQRDKPIWIAVIGDFGGLLGRVIPSEEMWPVLEKMKTEGTMSTCYLDDASYREDGKREQGRFGDMGGEYRGLAHLEPGSYRMDMILFAKRTLDYEGVLRLLQVDDSPLQIRVQQ